MGLHQRRRSPLRRRPAAPRLDRNSQFRRSRHAPHRCSNLRSLARRRRHPRSKSHALPAVSPYERRLVILLSLGGFFEFYDLLFSAYVAPGLVHDGILTTTGIAGFVSALFIGLFIGTATCGFLADRFGRRAIFTVSLLWYSAATLA